MTTLAWSGVVFGVVFAVAILLAIAYDVWAVEDGRETISQWCLRIGRAHPVVPALLGAVAGLLLGALIGHLWFPQHR